ncbi:hypothetical protein [Gracilimonas sp. BCB1]|uniref:hypothetical protein n=1 Tax=Gracilimonas sp. BCB1 TaxID=3152362 RepID=UPI0032D95D82
MTSFAIYEIIGFILALPLSYAMAWFARKYSKDTYKDELERLFSAMWNGREEDELTAWLQVKQIFMDKNAPKKMKYIRKKIDQLNKQNMYGSITVDEKGRIRKQKDSNPVHRNLFRDS